MNDKIKKRIELLKQINEPTSIKQISERLGLSKGGTHKFLSTIKSERLAEVQTIGAGRVSKTLIIWKSERLESERLGLGLFPDNSESERLLDERMKLIGLTKVVGGYSKLE